MPSATACRRATAPRSMIARPAPTSSPPAARSSTNDLSILRMSTGSAAGSSATSSRCRSRRSRAARRAPCSACSVRSPRSTSLHQHALGDLEHQRAGGEPPTAERGATSATRSGVLELAAREVDRSSSAAAAASAACQRAGLRGTPRAAPTRPSGTIRPVSSASGMNSPGETGRARGAASARAPRRPVIRAARPADDRLVVQRRTRCRARARVAGRPSSSSRSTRAACICGLEHLVARPCPRSLARVHRESALRSSSSGPSPRPARAMPMLTAATSSVASERDRRAQRRRSAVGRLGDVLARLADVLEQHRELVAAEPRDGVAAAQRCRAAARRPRAAARRRRAWPRLSLTVLKSSRSMNSTDRARRRGRCRASACSTRSRNSARFGSPVSASWNAWWVSCSSSAVALGDVARVQDDPADGRRRRAGSSRASRRAARRRRDGACETRRQLDWLAAGGRARRGTRCVRARSSSCDERAEGRPVERAAGA